MIIKNMRPVDNCGKTVAFFSVEWEGKMAIHECRLVSGANGLFTGPPQKEYTQAGQKKYKSIVYIEKELLEKITIAAEKEYRRVAHTSGQPNTDFEIPF